jgi:hypothetical protein
VREGGRWGGGGGKREEPWSRELWQSLSGGSLFLNSRDDSISTGRGSGWRWGEWHSGREGEQGRDLRGDRRGGWSDGYEIL